MSAKRFNLLEDPPTASSSDNDDDELETSIGEGDEIGGNSSSEEEGDESPINSAAIKHETSLSAATEKKQASESGSGSEEETDSDSETERRNPVKNPSPSVAKSAAESKKVESSAKSAARKRRVDSDEAAASTDTKRVKRVSPEEERKSVGGSGEETKKTYFQRVWSEEDEIALLQGIIDYKANTGVSPYDDTNGFYQLVKKSISFDVSKIQFMEKLRGLKKKFENNVGKGKNGEEPILSKSHDRKTFDLSKTIWGANGILMESAVKSNGKSKKSRKVETVKQEPVTSLPIIVKSREDEAAIKGEVSSKRELDTIMKSALVKSLSRFGVDDLSVEHGWSRLSSEDKKRFEEQWNVLQRKEFEFYSQKSGFINEVLTKMAGVFRPKP
ncbi:unnamed protein product [Cochlearia groenlandica]